MRTALVVRELDAVMTGGEELAEVGAGAAEDLGRVRPFPLAGADQAFQGNLDPGEQAVIGIEERLSGVGGRRLGDGLAQDQRCELRTAGEPPAGGEEIRRFGRDVFQERVEVASVVPLSSDS